MDSKVNKSKSTFRDTKERSNSKENDRKPFKKFDHKHEKKPVKRLKRNDLIQQTEKLKMMRKYKKMMRKEGVNVNINLNDIKNENRKHEKLSNDYQKTDKSDNDENKNENNFRKKDMNDKKFMSAYKKAQLEYENKMKEKQKKQEVFNLNLELWKRNKLKIVIFCLIGD